MIHVACALLIRGDRVLVTQRSARMPHPNKWEFPGGKIGKGESPEECIRREIREELDLIISIERPLSPVVHSYERDRITLYPFICRIAEGRISLFEHKSFRWLPVSGLDEVDFLEADVEVVHRFRDALAGQ